MKLGNFEIFLISDGNFWLDGGAMFGVVPKVLWEKTNPADQLNRIELGLNCCLIRAKNRNILIDTGVGDKLDRKFANMYRIKKSRNISDSLKAIGLSEADIDIVINTHLHFDHCGGNTKVEDGSFAPRFKKAKYLIQRQEWEDATHPNERTKASYLQENFIPVKEGGQLELIDGNEEIIPGVKTIVTGGHTVGHQVVLIESEGETALYLGDLVPTTSHIKIPYVMGYDLYPLDTMRKKKELLRRAVVERWLLIFEHDPKVFAGYLKEREGKFILKEEYL
ncbi:MAG TPA: MBL fold metallo-hydrolase [bacterium (Candidatus Stahlbacteria)]|nr:MBL fold metallo-hydrolase [Candidatus Stahlbacteria bacterium]